MRNRKKKSISNFYKLSNGQWLKVLFTYNNKQNIWFETIIIGNSKRKCNDCHRKTESSPKVYYGRSIGLKNGVESFAIALKELLKFEKTISNTQINIVGASDRLNKIYTRLERYGYKKHIYIKNNKKVSVMYKIII